jgi:hypothetical protein
VEDFEESGSPTERHDLSRITPDEGIRSGLSDTRACHESGDVVLADSPFRFRPVESEDNVPSDELIVPIAFDRLLVSGVRDRLADWVGATDNGS